MKTTINERFVKLLDSLDMNPSRFSKSVGKSYNAIESIIKGKTRPSYDVLESVFNNYPDLSRDWLLMGDGEMFRNTKQPDQSDLTDEYLHDHLKSLESNFARLAAQLESKDQQIAGLHRMLESVLGKSKGATFAQLSDEEKDFYKGYDSYVDTTVQRISDMFGVPMHRSVLHT